MAYLILRILKTPPKFSIASGHSYRAVHQSEQLVFLQDGETEDTA